MLPSSHAACCVPEIHQLASSLAAGSTPGAPDLAGTGAIVDFPAAEQPVISTALIGVYRRPAAQAAQTGL
jgi:hypothetical protein